MTFEKEIIIIKTVVKNLADHDNSRKEAFDPEFTVIANNITKTVNEDTDIIVNQLIEEGTRTPNVQVVRTKRLVSRNHFPGLVKIELASVTDKVTVLRNNRNLAENHEFRHVFLRFSKPNAAQPVNFVTQ